MKCPHCLSIEDRVLDTRVQKDGGIRRRRMCLSCKGRYTTLETILLNYPFIIKKDGRREAFSQEKLRRGVQLSCQKCPVSLAQIESVVTKIAKFLLESNEKEVASMVIGQEVMGHLRSLDDVAYVRFASVYRTFQDIQEFVDSLEGKNSQPSDQNSPH